MRKYINVTFLIASILLLFVLVSKIDVLPDIGDIDSAPALHVSKYYIEHSVQDTNSPNMVTAMIVDYRAFDTMFETTVMFLAGIGVIMILASRPKAKNRIVEPKRYFGHRHKLGDPAYKTINKDVMITLIEPLILIYAFYVLFHGEISLGGGFQSGALIALTYIIDILVIPDKKNLFMMTGKNSASIAGIGVLIYVMTGVVPMFNGGSFMDYTYLPIPVHAAERHAIGILLVEIGVTIGVMGTIITILNAIMKRVRFDDDTDKWTSGK
nr:hydrogen gas-evolving membrane-bound hydrogenase subunit E [uncultured Mogibacterium sp.]